MAIAEPPAPGSLFPGALRAGLPTVGGAYAPISFVQHDAVVVGGWMRKAQFLDGLAIADLLPAPLVIFVTFVGYLGGGLTGALAMAAGSSCPP